MMACAFIIAFGWLYAIKIANDLKKEYKQLKAQGAPMKVKRMSRSEIIKEIEETQAQKQAWERLMA